MIMFLALYFVVGVLLTLYAVIDNDGFEELYGTTSKERALIFTFITIAWIVLLPIAIWERMRK